MTLLEEMAVLLLAEKITRGSSFQEGMTVDVPNHGKAPTKVRATAEMVERATQVALQRHDRGFWEASKASPPPVATPGKTATPGK